MWGLVFSAIFALYDNPPRKTQAETFDKQGTSEIVQAPVEKPVSTPVNEVKPVEPPTPKVAPQPKQAEAPKPKPVITDPNSNQAIGQQMAAAKGWTGDQWRCLDSLWTSESHWRHTVANYQGSGAYGIPQALPASKMASHGSDYLTNPRTQIAWGLDYIKSRYGTPCGAWSSWNSRSPHWY